jgi:hypothetical protein
MSASLSPAVSPTPALARACLVPRPTKGSLSRRSASLPTFPVTLGHDHRDQLGPRPSSAAKLCSFRESVHVSHRFPGDPRSILSWAFRPSEAFSARASVTQTRLTAEAARHVPHPEGISSRPRGLQRPEGRLLPPRPGGPPPAKQARWLWTVVGFRSPSRPARAASRRRPYSPDLPTPRSKPRIALAFEAFECARSYVSPKRSLAPLRSCASSTTTRLWDPTGPGL